ncbi:MULTISPECIES: hypothetical protein [Micrococcaceae]|uniref:Uncharacterized protein n=1 Tax=Glutamicibacter ectropisis TaxID=3046593 RepID=A0AAU6WBP4_9MICC|nr:hypothetical protein [Arthrobacter sp. NIO-1057]KSU65276.1 hypothetical protein AS038_13155 [Arthrobacter sp. NIO-1057]SCC43810.1 hypothetical protein GA0061084_2679 [Arthrobacter sp. NIO-1057]
MATIPLGEDILLVRHGANIVKLRQDRKNRATIAFLRDGQTDSASNVSTVAAPALTPAASISKGAAKYLNDEAEVSRGEVRSLVKISLGFSAVMGTVFGGLLLALYKVGGNEAIQSLAYMGGGVQ